MRAVDGLDELTDDVRPGRIGELGKLLQVLIGRPSRAESLARRADENRALGGRFDRDQFLADVRLLYS
jgi:hypothetical protein